MGLLMSAINHWLSNLSNGDCYCEKSDLMDLTDTNRVSLPGPHLGSGEGLYIGLTPHIVKNLIEIPYN